MKILEHVPLAPYTTFGIGGPARYFVELASEDDVCEAVRWALDRELPTFTLGGGSNLLVPDDGFAGLVMRMNIRGVERSDGMFGVCAGEPWDEFVSQTVDAECAGVECLAGIPGSIGGTPVQNVGAYGQEVSETVASVQAYDRQHRQFVELSNAECGFRYRESIFNTTERGRYIVTRVRFQLRPGGEPTLLYADLQRRFAGTNEAPRLREVADAVREIRRGKGMLIVEGDPDCRSAGSFFKNPVVSREQFVRLVAIAGLAESDVPHWPANNDEVKLPAAWLLERAGFVKGFGGGPVKISSRHTLAIVNSGGAKFTDVDQMHNVIVNGIQAKFGVELKREPVVMKTTEPY